MTIEGFTWPADAPHIRIPLELFAVPDLTPSRMHVLAYLAYRAGRRGWWYGSHREIGAALGISEHTTRQATVFLRRNGYIETSRTGAEDGTVLRYTIRRVEPTDPARSVGQATTDQDGSVGAITGDRSERSLAIGATDHEGSVQEDPQNSGENSEENSLSGRARWRRLPASSEELEIDRYLLVALGIQAPPLEWARSWLERGRTVEDVRLAIDVARERHARSTRYVDRILEDVDGLREKRRARVDGAAEARNDDSGTGHLPHVEVPDLSPEDIEYLRQTGQIAPFPRPGVRREVIIDSRPGGTR